MWQLSGFEVIKLYVELMVQIGYTDMLHTSNSYLFNLLIFND